MQCQLRMQPSPSASTMSQWQLTCDSHIKQTLQLVWQYTMQMAHKTNSAMQICPTKQTLLCRSVLQNKLCYWSGNTQCRSVVQNKLCYWSGNTQCRNVLQKQTLLLVGQNSVQICQIQIKLCHWSGNNRCRSHNAKEYLSEN